MKYDKYSNHFYPLKIPNFQPEIKQTTKVENRSRHLYDAYHDY